MSYTTIERVQQTEEKLRDANVMNNDRLTIFVEDAEAQIDSAIARKYAVPVTGTPPILRTIATDLAIYRALRSIFTEQQLQDSDWPAKFKDAEEMLEKIASGEMMIPGTDGTLVAGRTDIDQVTSNTKDYEPTFTDLGPLEDIDDPDKLDDLRDERDIGIRDILA